MARFLISSPRPLYFGSVGISHHSGVEPATLQGGLTCIVGLHETDLVKILSDRQTLHHILNIDRDHGGKGGEMGRPP